MMIARTIWRPRLGVALVVSLLVLLIGSHPLPATSAPLLGFDIAFDGYCDGMHLNIPSVGLNTLDTTDGYSTGCVSSPVFGSVTYLPNLIHITTLYDNTTIEHWVIDLEDHSVQVYGFGVGDTIILINTGTWTYGMPGTRPGFPAGAGPGKSIDPPHSSLEVIQVDYQGFCDGMILAIPSRGLGTKGTLDGRADGCRNQPLIGSNVQFANGVVRTAHVTTAPAGPPWQYVLHFDHIWDLYELNGDQIRSIGHGTWTFGPPGGQALPTRDGLRLPMTAADRLR